MTRFTDLPPEMIREIGRYLPQKDLVNLREAMAHYSDDIITQVDISRAQQAHLNNVRVIQSFQMPFNESEAKFLSIELFPALGREAAARRLRLEHYILLNNAAESAAVGEIIGEIGREYMRIYRIGDMPSLTRFIAMERRIINSIW